MQQALTKEETAKFKEMLDKIPPLQERLAEVEMGTANMPREEILRNAFMAALEMEQVKRRKQEVALVASKEASTAEAEAAAVWQQFEAKLATYLGKDVPNRYD